MTRSERLTSFSHRSIGIDSLLFPVEVKIPVTTMLHTLFQTGSIGGGLLRYIILKEASVAREFRVGEEVLHLPLIVIIDRSLDYV